MSDADARMDGVPLDGNASLDDILSDAMDRAQRGETVAACLALYPDHAEELAPLLEAAVASAAVLPAPEAPYRDAARYRFQGAVRHHLSQQRSGRRDARPAPRRWSYRFPIWSRAWVAATAGLMLTVILGGGVAFASSDAMPDSPLYPVKRVTERARLAVTPSDDARALYHLALIERRASELSAMAEAGNAELVDQLSVELLKEIEFARVEAGLSGTTMSSSAMTTAEYSSAPQARAMESAQLGTASEAHGETPEASMSRALPDHQAGRLDLDERAIAYLNAEQDTANRSYTILRIAQQHAPDHLKDYLANLYYRAEERYETARAAPVPRATENVLFAQGVAVEEDGNVSLANGLVILPSRAVKLNRAPRNGDVVTVGGYLRTDGSMEVLRLHAAAGGGAAPGEILFQAPVLGTTDDGILIPGFTVVMADGAAAGDVAITTGEWVYVAGTVTAPGVVRATTITRLPKGPIPFPG